MTHTFNIYQKGNGNLFVYLHLHHDYHLIRRSTGVTCERREWDPKKRRLKGAADFIRQRNEIINQWDAAANSACFRATNEGLSPNECVELILQDLGIKSKAKSKTKSKAPSTRAKAKAKSRTPSPKKRVDPKSLFLPFYLHWATYSTSFKKCDLNDKWCYNVLKNYLGERGQKFTFDDVNYEFYCSYVDYLQKRGFKPNTVGDHVKKLKAVMNSAFKKELHNNQAYRTFVKPSVEVFNVYLTDDEISSLLSLEFSDSQSTKVRDLFIISCRTGLRFSDAIRLTSDMIQNGRIHIWQQKTSDDIVIPAHPDVIDILNRYGGKSPNVSKWFMNSQIKVIARAAGITQKVTYTTVEANNVKRTVTQEKCELITSHTARRSFATNAYLAGIPTISIMKLTGHKSESSFMKYIKITKEQIADQLMDNPFFKR